MVVLHLLIVLFSQTFSDAYASITPPLLRREAAEYAELHRLGLVGPKDIVGCMDR